MDISRPGFDKTTFEYVLAYLLSERIQFRRSLMSSSPTEMREELNDVITDLNMPKDSSELLVSRPNEKNPFRLGTTVSY